MYRAQSEDTSEAIDRMLIAAYRDMPAWEKFDRIRALSQTAHELAASGERMRHPDASEDEVLIAVASRLLGAELVRRAVERRGREAPPR